MAVVNINVGAYLNPPLYNVIQMTFFESNDVCYRPKGPYQIDTTTFVEESLIYKIDNNVAPIGWYSDGINRGQWDGEKIISFSPCVVFWEPSDPYCLTNEIILNPFDHLVVRFMYNKPSNGTDLDIMVYYDNTGTVYDKEAVGFGQNPNSVKIPTDSTADGAAYLWWASDDVSSPAGLCIEAVVIGVKNFVDNVPVTADTIEIPVRVGWYGSRGDGNISVELVTYLGGTMSKVGTNIVNTGGVLVDNQSTSINVTSFPGQVTELHSDLVGTVIYNKITKTAILSI